MKGTRRWRIWGVFLFVSLAGLVLVAACGGDNEENGATPEGGSVSKVAQCQRTGEKSFAGPPEMIIDQGKTYVAHMSTDKGDITIELAAKDAPNTVNNFVFLSCKGFYDGLTFHRVIPSFMIQAGCPLGNGTGGPGFQFKDEFSRDLRFDRPGKLAMANSDPNTNGSQFFITVAATDWLNNHHTIFGEVVRGYEVVEKIAKVPRDRSDRPTTPVVMKTVRITEVK